MKFHYYVIIKVGINHPTKLSFNLVFFFKKKTTIHETNSKKKKRLSTIPKPQVPTVEVKMMVEC